MIIRGDMVIADKQSTNNKTMKSHEKSCRGILKLGDK